MHTHYIYIISISFSISISIHFILFTAATWLAAVVDQMRSIRLVLTVLRVVMTVFDVVLTVFHVVPTVLYGTVATWLAAVVDQMRSIRFRPCVSLPGSGIASPAQKPILTSKVDKMAPTGPQIRLFSIEISKSRGPDIVSPAHT
jgi:hypothetical protein